MGSVWALGILQGLTEFLPISSSGHLIVAKTWFGVASPGAALEVALHVGTLGAVLWVYRHWLKTWLTALAKGEKAAVRLLARLIVATIPAGLVGFFLGDVVQAYFVVSAVVLGWLCTALLLWVTPAPQRGSIEIGGMSTVQAFLIGLAQALALWPGLSRSGTTIAMARTLGMRPDDAAQFSFLLAIPTVVGASVFELPAIRHATIPWHELLIGAVFALLTGVIAIQWMKGLVNRQRAWRGFSIYLALMAICAWMVGG